MSKNDERQDTQAPGHYGNKGLEPKPGRAKGPDREEQYQRNRDQAPTDQGGQMDHNASPDPDNNLGRGAPSDREERIRQLAKEKERTPK